MSIYSHGLTTRLRLKDFLDISDDTATTNSVLDRLVNLATDWIENYCGRRFQRGSYTEYYDGEGSQELLMRNYPIISGETFTLSMRSAGNNEDSWTSIDSEDYYIDYQAGLIKFPTAALGGRGRLFIRGAQNYRVLFTSGYYVPSDALYVEGNTASLPGDLEYIAWKLCGAAWSQRRGDPSVAEERLGYYSVKFKEAAMESQEVVDVLDKYSRKDAIAWR